jgi:hypothetical protein
MASTVTAMPSAWRVTSEPSDYRVDRAGFVIRSAVQMTRHEATYGSSGARLTPPQCNLTE